MVKISIISVFLGAGKTTFIRNCSKKNISDLPPSLLKMIMVNWVLTVWLWKIQGFRSAK